MKLKIENIAVTSSSIAEKISFQIPEIPVVNYKETKQRSSHYRKKVTAIIVSVVLILTLSGCIVAKYIYFGNMEYFKNMKNDEYVTVVNETRTVDNRSITLQAVMTDGLKTYARLKYNGDIDSLGKDGMYNPYVSSVTPPSSSKFFQGIYSIGIEDIKTSKMYFAEINSQLLKSNTATVNSSRLDSSCYEESLSSGLQENEVIISFDKPMKDNQKFNIRLLLADDGNKLVNKYEDFSEELVLKSNKAFVFKNITVKCPKVVANDVSKRNIAFQTDFDSFKVNKITTTILHTYIDVECTPNEKYRAPTDYGIDYTHEYYENPYFFKISCNGESQNIIGAETLRFSHTDKNSKFTVALYKGYPYSSENHEEKFIKNICTFTAQ